MLNYRNNRLFVEGVPVSRLGKRFGTPLFIYSKKRIEDNYNAYRNAFSSVKNLICFANKSNSNRALLKILKNLGSGVDITSGGELYRALDAGFNPKKIVYAGIGKTEAEIIYALKSDILMFNVESIEELELLNRAAGRLKKKALIAFRINPNVDPHTHHYITTGKSGSKFGIPYEQAVAFYCYATTLENIEPAGIHCHIGSQITEVKPFLLAAKRVKKIIDELSLCGIRIRYADLGGGLGIRYRNENAPTPKGLARALSGVLKGFRGTIILEPGRSIVGDTCVLLSQVTYRKRVADKNYLIVDAGMNDLIRPTLYEAYHDIVPAERPARAKVRLDVVGPICETGDFIGKDRMLPWLGQGEFLAAKCAGAYGFSMSSQYNSRTRAAEVLVDGSKAVLIRKRETYADLVSKERR
ncbi:MAG: diaminopimelate decarboxylase [Endomicrobiales bacterium]|nr:diaminopimelate decarboxylase [Endomicrobiales bacterium]